jgi:FG-GAP repeat/PEP-CTERM motif
MRAKTLIVAVVAVLMTVGAAQASTVSPVQVVPPDITPDGSYGLSGYLAGDTAFISAPLSDDKGVDSGSVYIYHKQGEDWQLARKALASDGTAGDLFGRRIYVDGDYAVIAATSDDQNGAMSGSAYVFQRSGNDWVERQKLLAPNGAANDYLAWSVGIQGDRIILGADGHEGKGAAFIYQRNSQGTWILDSELKASDGQAVDVFGHWVAIDKDIAVVGASGRDDRATDSGAAYVYRKVEGAWIQEAKLLAPDGVAHDNFGTAVTIEGDRIVVGAHRVDANGFDTGAAYVYQQSGDTWAFQQKLMAHDGSYMYFGNTVDLKDGILLVGAYNPVGAVYAFRSDATGWHEVAEFTSDGQISVMPGENALSLGRDILVGSYVWPVPEPATLSLLALGGVAVLKRRRKRQV